MAPPGISIENLALRYAGASVFENLSFQVAPGQFVVLLGPSGVGKSSLLRVIAGLEMPAVGSVRATDGEKLAGRVAYMGQQDLLFPWARVLDNVMLGSRLRGGKTEKHRARG